MTVGLSNLLATRQIDEHRWDLLSVEGRVIGQIWRKRWMDKGRSAIAYKIILRGKTVGDWHPSFLGAVEQAGEIYSSDASFAADALRVPGSGILFEARLNRTKVGGIGSLVTIDCDDGVRICKVIGFKDIDPDGSGIGTVVMGVLGADMLVDQEQVEVARVLSEDEQRAVESEVGHWWEL